VYSEPVPVEVDYIIGSTHFVFAGGEYQCIDRKPWENERIAREYYGGDFIALAEDYYAGHAQVYERTRCDIIGHFDLITKFNRDGAQFDTADPRYRAAWQKAADELLKCGKPFEINTGVIYRGRLDTPYPALEIARYISERGGEFVLSSDSHYAAGLCYGFEQWAQAAKAEGIKVVPFALPEKK